MDICSSILHTFRTQVKYLQCYFRGEVRQLIVQISSNGEGDVDRLTGKEVSEVHFITVLLKAKVRYNRISYNILYTQ